MAAPITHIILALSMLPSLSNLDTKQFIIGTSFPDIRYLNVINRDETHNKQATWKSIKQETSSFKAGMDFHALVDRIREKYMVEHDVYNLMPKSKYISQCLKLFEDKILYKELKNKREIIDFFNTITQEELAFNIQKRDVKKWHEILQNYFAKQPDIKNIITFYLYIKYNNRIMRLLLKPLIVLGATYNTPFFSNKKIKEISDIFDQLEQNEKLKNIIFNFYDVFPKLLQEHG